MTAYAGGCSVSVTLSPVASVGSVFQSDCATSVLVSPRALGPIWPSYTDENGVQQTVVLAEWYKGRSVEQSGKTTKYSREFLVHGTYETTDCTDIGPQVGDEDDVMPGMFVSSRKLMWYAQGGGDKKTYSDVVKIVIDYEQPNEPQSSGGDSEGTLSFDFGSESEHIDQAISQTTYGPAPKDGEGLLVNFDGETLEGLDIDAPILTFTEEHTFTEAQFNQSFRTQLSASVKKINSTVWRGYPIGNVLFDGASATKKNKQWFVSFRFRTRVGFTNKQFTIYKGGNPEIVTVSKTGWQYLWFKLGKSSTDNATKFQVAALSVHKADVYASLDFGTLGIGTQPLN